MLNISLPLANILSSISNFSLIVGTILALAGTIGAIWTGGIKERYADERISANEAKAAVAGADAERAKAQAARANENAEIVRQSNLALQADVERERAARLQLEGKVAPRHLSVAQKAALVNALEPFKGQAIEVVIPMGDTEAKAFAGDFINVFRAAGWNAGKNDGINQAVYSGPPVRGIQVTINEESARANQLPRGAQQLIRALMGLGLTKMAYADPQTAPGKIEFRVGSKEE